VRFVDGQSGGAVNPSNWAALEFVRTDTGATRGATARARGGQPIGAAAEDPRTWTTRDAELHEDARFPGRRADVPPPRADATRWATEARRMTPAQARAAMDILPDLTAHARGDRTATARLQARNLHQLPNGILEGTNRNFEGWWSVDLTGRQDPQRLIFNVNADRSVDWRVRDTHQGGRYGR
jgi:hypothetical protein